MSALNGAEMSNLNQRQTMKWQKCCDAVDEHNQKIEDIAQELQKTKSLVAELKEELASAKDALKAKREIQQTTAADLRSQLARKGVPTRR